MKRWVGLGVIADNLINTYRKSFGLSGFRLSGRGRLKKIGKKRIGRTTSPNTLVGRSKNLFWRRKVKLQAGKIPVLTAAHGGGGVAVIPRKWSRSEKLRMGWSLTSYVSECVLKIVCEQPPRLRWLRCPMELEAPGWQYRTCRTGSLRNGDPHSHLPLLLRRASCHTHKNPALEVGSRTATVLALQDQFPSRMSIDCALPA